MSQKTQRSFASKCARGTLHLVAHVRGTIGSAISCECGCSSDAPAAVAVVLEDQDVPEPRVLLQVEHALAERPQHALDGDDRQRGQRLRVLGRLDDHLVGADAVHLVEQPLALAVERALDLQRGELVRDDPHVPPGRRSAPPPAR